MKKLLGIVVLGLLWFMPVNADNHSPDKNPEIILDLGGNVMSDIENPFVLAARITVKVGKS